MLFLPSNDSCSPQSLEEERVLILCLEWNTVDQNCSCKGWVGTSGPKRKENVYQLPTPSWFSYFPNSFGSPLRLSKVSVGSNCPAPLGTVSGNLSVTEREVVEPGILPCGQQRWLCHRREYTFLEVQYPVICHHLKETLGVEEGDYSCHPTSVTTLTASEFDLQSW